mmetsp:Transcript_39511/g.92928  ORF Transcript_39511/g.92928 Transcript_39511/m.92928 type:complete len:291 (+) Transcript_39511:194-1066(+)
MSSHFADDSPPGDRSYAAGGSEQVTSSSRFSGSGLVSTLSDDLEPVSGIPYPSFAEVPMNDVATDAAARMLSERSWISKEALEELAEDQAACNVSKLLSTAAAASPPPTSLCGAQATSPPVNTRTSTPPAWQWQSASAPEAQPAPVQARPTEHQRCEGELGSASWPPSFGSQDHDYACSPCYFFSQGRCIAGYYCRHCHYDHGRVFRPGKRRGEKVRRATRIIPGSSSASSSTPRDTDHTQFHVTQEATSSASACPMSGPSSTNASASVVQSGVGASTESSSMSEWRMRL